MYAHPWALRDRGMDAALEELRACGIDGIQLALSYHVASYLMPSGRSRRVVDGDLGGLTFEPAGGEVSWPFPPPVSAAGTAGSAEVALEAAARHRLDAVAWIVYCYNHALARGRPDLAVRNAFDEPSGAHLCPANPDVQAYVRALTRAALALGPVASLHVESLGYHPFDHGLLNLKSAVRPSPRARQLLSLCFCVHCKSAARSFGLDADAIARGARRRIDEDLRTPPGETLGEMENASPAAPDFARELEGWTSVHARTVEDLHREVFELARTAGVRTGSYAVEADGLGLTGRAPSMLRKVVDEVRFRLEPTLSPAEVAGRISASRRGAKASVTTYAFADMARFTSERGFAEAVGRAAEHGIEHFRFYEFGVLGPWHFAWIRGQQAAWQA